MDAFVAYVSEAGALAVPAFTVLLLVRIFFDLVSEFVVGRRGRG